ncbi:efflux RND transporter periplasmic adaptor subunit [Pleionea mediterranea]|uniref:RND family efflux transporter MFP subunit n=1 Tax=Pleionea mediterranea TaxID=523701 RepID=A0A316FW90_9GAMM|nr:efflux RND transporter periplasmic adaptor subunit [Pleionea mediterranea]PWK53074.1 RND family efflux transporter MFP subunit [Pleionea mediterranea]
MSTKFLKPLLLLIALGVFHSQPVLSGGGHPHDGSNHEDEKNHGAETPANVVTQYNNYTELFVEFPPLVVNQAATFVTHFTRLNNFKAVTEGTLDVILSRNRKVVARFRVKKPARKGIFLPDVVPNKTGIFELALELKTDSWTSRHNLGSITVFNNLDEAYIENKSSDAEVSYLKEQQWENPFAISKSQFVKLRTSVPGFGTVTAPLNQYTIIRAPDDGYFSSGKIISAGESVNINDELGSLIPRLGEDTDIGELIVDLERAKSRFELAKADVKRLKQLFNKGSVSEKLYMEAQKELNIAVVELKTTQSRLRQRSGGVESVGINIEAPIKGEVLSVHVHPGSFVREGDPMFSLAAKEMRWLKVQVPEKFGEKIHTTSGVWLKHNNRTLVLDKQSQALIVNTSREVNPLTRTVEVAIAYPSEKGPSLIGARLPVYLYIGEPKLSLAIPVSAIIDDNGQSVVYVQTNGESFERRVVTLGIRDNNTIEITSGIEPNEWVVSKGAYYVKLASTGGDSIGHGHAH